MPTEFAFINNDNPDKIKDPKTRRTVRRHVMKDIGMSRRRGGCTSSSRTTPTHPLSPTIPSFVPYLDSWEDSQAGSHVASIYLALDIVDEAVLRLCRTNLALNFLRQEPRAVNKLNMESDECLKVYTRSISFVRQTLLPGEILDESVSDSMLGTIVCLAFYDMQNLNFHQWKIHMNGMMKIIQDQGGFTRLESRSELHQSLFWSDVLGSLIIDTVPRIPLPRAIAASNTRRCASPTFVDQSYHIFSQRFPKALDLLVPLRSLEECAYVEKLPSTPMAAKAGWRKSVIQFANAAHEVLVLSRLHDFQSYTSPLDRDGQEELRESIRVTIITFLLMLARNGAADDMYDARFVRGRVAGLMPSIEHIDWSGIEDLRLWILVISALDETGESRMYLVDQIRLVIGSLGLAHWDEVVQRVAEVAWMGSRFSEMSTRLEQDVFFDPSLGLSML
jgi:hypothetical protein